MIAAAPFSKEHYWFSADTKICVRDTSETHRVNHHVKDEPAQRCFCWEVKWSHIDQNNRVHFGEHTNSSRHSSFHYKTKHNYQHIKGEREAHTHHTHFNHRKWKKNFLLVPQNGRWLNSNSQKSHRDLVQWKSIMAPSKGNDFFCPSSRFSTMKRNKTHTRARTHMHTQCKSSLSRAAESHVPLRSLFRSFIPSVTLNDSK